MNTPADHQPTQPTIPNVSVFALRYTDTAALGLPPIVFANTQVAVESDGAWWWEFYLDAPLEAVSSAPLRVFRIPQRDVASWRAHDTLVAAINAANVPT